MELLLLGSASLKVEVPGQALQFVPT